jgi:hypothetical protein
MADTTIYASTASIAPSAGANDSGHDSGAESDAMAASYSPTRGAIRMAKGGDSRLLQEDDRDRRRPPGIPRPWMADR